ncbi:hypothetical protein H4W23_33760 [Streptomyces gardneri]|uniref:hypothetical protein n=1 Tax=Streptomyces gardneri TaxID=66892 RepID=UPI001266199E|nr:hypothetical protein [Streptomyces gardneri]QPK49114.1 hypothetical protein H4W23_33760 [Streptomyces gardneri]WRK40614.1 hypothetical protein U0M97_33920 [Streptomyces venezuelae]
MSDAVVQIERIRCIMQEEVPADEVVLRQGGIQIWPDCFQGTSLSDGTEAVVARVVPFGDSPEAVITLIEQDNPGVDDILGTVVIHESEAGAGLRTADITTPGSKYRLTYRVGRVQF